ncbi:extracellular calcium-sensing receptor-like [Enoplosus armatus]|uniref:extracellular calcium-sensing receptor-like n=1 Tax=Enoplosus armatus TaxID=215367 RepID=UPI0039955E51
MPGLRKGVNRWKVMWAFLDINLLLLMFFMLLYSCFSSAVSSHLYSSSCRLQGQFHLNGMHKAGDVVLGGLFGTHLFSIFPDLSFTSEPQQPSCHGFDVLGFRQAQTMAFAIDEINRNSNLLPNVTLGYSLYDNCIKLRIGFRAALSLISGQEEQFMLDETCVGTPPVLGIVGDSSSTRSIAISTVLGLYRVPMVSYFATCSCLSDRQKFPSFFRTIPSDAFQVRAMIQILKRFGWTWAGLLVSDDDYGLHAARSFQSDFVQSGEGCLAYLEILPWGNDPAELRRIVGVMKKSTVRVIIVFAHESYMIDLMEEVVRQNVTGLQWMASEAWIAATVLQTPHLMPYLGGTLGIAIRRGEIAGLREFLSRIRPDLHHNSSYGNSMVEQFWEYTFECRFAPLPAGWVEDGGALCTGQEDLENVETEFLDISNLRPEYNVYKAVYALAYALDDMLQCEPGRGPFIRHSCANLQRLEPWQLVYYLEKVNFTTPFGDQVSFDENGDVLPIYDIMNWLWLPDGRTKVQNVGEVKRSAFKDEELTIDEKKIFWNFGSKKPPRSVCSESCPPGTRMARRKGEPVCCFDCIPCSEGKISNKTDSIECTSCQEDFWSSPQHDHCVPKETEFLSYHEPLGICLTTASLLGTFICTVVLGIFIYHRRTPIVRANNSELSFQLLVSLKLCFLCSLLFIGRPRLWTCQLRHAAFGISFVLCVSCILVKTMVVLAVFKASKPGGGASLKWFGVLQQRGTVMVLTSIQAAICTAWLVSSSPVPHKNTQYNNDKIVYECVVGSTVGFAVLLGYIGLLAILSFLIAFIARNLPDSFNEAKLITFSMLIFCAVWVAFVPAYISSPGKYADAVEVFAILASSFSLLASLFGPKCYIILLRPERNTKKAIMGRGIQS